MCNITMTSKELPILIIDKNQPISSTLADELRSLGYRTLTISNLEELDKIIDAGNRFLLSVVNLSGFDDTIWERCDRIRSGKTPCIAITPQRSSTTLRETIIHGVDALLVYPVSIKEIIQHIRTTIGD